MDSLNSPERIAFRTRILVSWCISAHKADCAPLLRCVHRQQLPYQISSPFLFKLLLLLYWNQSVPKESVLATPVNQLHHMTNRTITKSPPRPHSQPPTYPRLWNPLLPAPATILLAARAHLMRLCAGHFRPSRPHTTQLHAPVPTSAVPSWRSRAWVRPAACARVIRNVDTFKQAVQY